MEEILFETESLEVYAEGESLYIIDENNGLEIKVTPENKAKWIADVKRVIEAWNKED